MVAKLSYVLLDGEPQHVSSFVEIKPRPVVLCSRCRERVDLVLGTQRVHHARHRPGSGCALAGGESALHENVTLHIALQLRRSSGRKGWTGLRLRETCSCCCFGTREVWHYVSWDDVKVEATVGGWRPDVLLLHGGAPVLAVEVFASHKTSVEKRTYYESRKLAWVEVTADESLLGDGGWTTLEALPVAPRTSWTCERCVESKARHRQAIVSA